MAELKPCPFCGGEANICCRSTVNERELLSKIFSIQCTKCGVVSPKAFRVFAQIYNDGTFEFNDSEESEAIEAWNKRADVQKVRHGRWVRFIGMESRYFCDQCRRHVEDRTGKPWEAFPYCHCGAKMDEEVE